MVTSKLSDYLCPGGERGGSVVECRTPEREVGGSKPTSAVLCPWARHFTPRKSWLITQEAVAPSRHDWKIVDWDVKPQHKQNKTCVLVGAIVSIMFKKLKEWEERLMPPWNESLWLKEIQLNLACNDLTSMQRFDFLLPGLETSQGCKCIKMYDHSICHSQPPLCSFRTQTSLVYFVENIIWAATWQNQQNECAPSENSDQPGHSPSLIRVFAGRSMGS